MAKKIKEIKIKKSKIKEIKKEFPKNQENQSLEEEVREMEVEGFARFLSPRRLTRQPLEEEEISGGRLVRVIPREKEDEVEAHFRPSYTGSNPYDSSNTYQGVESSGPSESIDSRNANPTGISQERSLGDRARNTEQLQRGEGAERREYAGREKSDKDRRVE